MRKIVTIIVLACALSVQAQQWRTLFAYNNVTQIALGDECVYGLSDGSLFSVNKQTEQLRIYDNQSGLHSTDITCIHFDATTGQLIIAYRTGKIDLLSQRGVRYMSDLYDKDMTQRKTVYNITIHGRTAYLSTHYGVQTLDLVEHKLVDAYWLRPNGEETPVSDVRIEGDSIYAFTTDSLFVGALSDNLSDYTFWRREQRSGRISPDPNKGVHYQDGADHWYAGGTEGIKRVSPTETMLYKPQGPLVNTPNRIACSMGKLYIVPGGRWSSQNKNPGVVMLYNGDEWLNITTESIQAVTNKPVLDFMNVAVDPRDSNHYFVTSYGTGLYEFQETQCVSHYVADTTNTLGAAAPDAPDTYTRIDYATFDANGHLWMLDAGAVSYQMVCLDDTGGWHGLPLIEEEMQHYLHTPGGLILDNRNSQYKWFVAARYNTLVGLLDDSGTPFDASDDRVVTRSSWISQTGQSFMPMEIWSTMQDRDGRIWLGTEQGLAVIDTVDYFSSDLCLRPVVLDSNGENPLESQRIMALYEDLEGRIWVGTERMGVYVLNRVPSAEPAKQWQLAVQYTTDNSAMPSNNILSLAGNSEGFVYVGTAEGLVEYNSNYVPQGLQDTSTEQKEMDEGYMQRWRLHYSYSNPQEIDASAERIYAVGNGALFYLNRSNESLEYLSKATGLNGNTVAHIAYDAKAKRLVIAYEDGRIDLLGDDDRVYQMPDLYMKASSVAVTINDVTVGPQRSYLAMTFGVIAIDTRKVEVVDTYYIGAEAASVDVKQVALLGDSIYALTEGRLYSASMTDNLADYTYWHRSPIKEAGLTQAVVYKDSLYALLHDTLYCYRLSGWKQVEDKPIKWVHVSGSKMLLYIDGEGLYEMGDNYALTGLTNRYIANDAVYTNGEYWLAEQDYGFIRVTSAGMDHFHPSCPNSNFSYCLTTSGGQIYSGIGGRWASQYQRRVKLNIYDGNNWRTLDWHDMFKQTGYIAMDPVSIAVDPNDAGHFFVATYGTGVWEFRNYNEQILHYDFVNSTLLPAIKDIANPEFYTRADGAVIDEKGNLWVLNATDYGSPVHVRTPNGSWHGLNLKSGGQAVRFTTPANLYIDRRNSQRKWMVEQRIEAGVILLDDGGTPTNSSDDRSIKRTTFVDQNGRTITPEYVLCLTQDLKNRIWVGTQAGILVIPAAVDFFSSNTCHRIIIPRNDGTGLGDYLLGDERINCLTPDGGNRMWIGTANSGLYLIEDDTITVAHFTADNSLLPSNYIQSIVIEPTTGEVFVGTDRGIASYRSDASEARDNLQGAYAFPNPVRPDYSGVISIAGLMEETVVNIVDAGGNLVCKTRSHGGMAVWDGKLPDGRRAKSGVYTALCNAPGGEHTVVKILVVR